MATVATAATGHDPPAEAADAADAADAAVAGAAITALSAPVTHDQLADALGWPLARLLAAIDEALEQHLGAAGARLITDEHPLHGVEPRHGLLTDQQRQCLHRAGAAATVLDPEPAHTLYELCEFDRRLTEPDHSSDNCGASVERQCSASLGGERGYVAGRTSANGGTTGGLGSKVLA